MPLGGWFAPLVSHNVRIADAVDLATARREDDAINWCARPVDRSQSDVATAHDYCRVDSNDVNAMRAKLMLIPRLWPRDSAAVCLDFGRPTFERNRSRKFTTQSTHSSVDASLKGKSVPSVLFDP